MPNFKYVLYGVKYIDYVLIVNTLQFNMKKKPHDPAMQRNPIIALSTTHAYGVAVKNNS